MWDWSPTEQSTVTHASALSQLLPVAGYLGKIRKLQRHAQTYFAQSSMIVLHKLHNLFTLFGCQIIVLEQVALAKDLSNTQDLVTCCV